MARSPKKDLMTWMNNMEYLPRWLRDFHHQKDIFKTIHTSLKVEDHAEAKRVDWIAGHCYVVDVFLWFMAQHGYTLQKSRQAVDFKQLNATLKAWELTRNELPFKLAPITNLCVDCGESQSSCRCDQVAAEARNAELQHLINELQITAKKQDIASMRGLIRQLTDLTDEIK